VVGTGGWETGGERAAEADGAEGTAGSTEGCDRAPEGRGSGARGVLVAGRLRASDGAGKGGHRSLRGHLFLLLSSPLPLSHLLSPYPFWHHAALRVTQANPYGELVSNGAAVGPLEKRA